MSPGIVAESDLSGNLQSEYVFFEGERVARKDFPSNAVSYYFSDHLKTASVITDPAGNIKEDEDYYPWGGELKFVDNDSNHYKFTGKELDGETGLDYFGARYYSNPLGRFVTPDWSNVAVPVPYADLVDPQSLNQYSYVRNIPTSKTDPDGHCTIGGKQYGWWDCLTHRLGFWETSLERKKRIEGERSDLLQNTRNTNGGPLSPAQRWGLLTATTAQIDQLYKQLKQDAANLQTENSIRQSVGLSPLGPSGVPENLYRGGKSLEATPGDVKIDPQTGLLKTTHGVSLDAEPAGLGRFGGANEINQSTVPAELKIEQRGIRPDHYEIMPRQPMTMERYQQLLSQIKFK